MAHPDDPRSRPAEAAEFGESARGRFGISEGIRRVGAPPLRPLPLESCNSLIHPLRQVVEECTPMEELLEGVKRILGSHKIPYYPNRVEFTGRHIPREPWTMQPTVLIVADWRVPSCKMWKDAVREIKVWVDGAVHNRLDLDISVEIIGREHVWEKHIECIMYEYSMDRKWPIIRDRVRRILEVYPATKGLWTTIALFRLGESTTWRISNPITVYISMSYESPESGWQPVVDAIQQYLDDFDYYDVQRQGIQVWLEHGRMEYYSFEGLTPSNQTIDQRDRVAYGAGVSDEYQQEVNMGANIGVSQYAARDDGVRCNPSFGTLGCYLEIKTKGQRNWTKVALTAYHVMRPAFQGFRFKARPATYGLKEEFRSVLKAKLLRDTTLTEAANPLPNSDLEKVDSRGFWPKSSQQAHSLEQPARLRHNYDIDCLDRAIKKREESLQLSLTEEQLAGAQKGKTILEQSRVRKAAFFDQNKHHLGKIRAASGASRRSTTNGRLDWALISVDETRTGNNKIPQNPTSWPPMSWPDAHPSNMGTLLKAPSESSSLRNMAVGENLFMIGATSGPCSGKFVRYPISCVMGEGEHGSIADSRHSTEYILIMKGPYGRRGDSGAAVFDAEGRIVGMVLGGQTPQGVQASFCVVTPIEDILEDIKESSKGQITDIRLLM